MRYDIVAISNALLDFLIYVDDIHLEKLRLKKGIFHLLTEDQVHNIIAQFRSPVINPAGASANTAMAMSALGARTVLLGMVGADKYGQEYEVRVKGQGVLTRLQKNPRQRTGIVVNLVTDDAERTFAVNLGAAGMMKPEDILEDDIGYARYLYFTGYEYESMTDTVLHAVDIAKKHQTKIVMDLADAELVARNLDELKSLASNVDILFMNEHEAKSFTGKEPRESARIVGKTVETVVIKTGAEGSIIVSSDREYLIPAEKIKALDTTGAGDLYAAGFLYSLIKGKTVEQAGRFGSFMGTRAVSQVGALMTDKMKNEVRKKFESI